MCIYICMYTYIYIYISCTQTPGELEGYAAKRQTEEGWESALRDRPATCQWPLHPARGPKRANRALLFWLFKGTCRASRGYRDIDIRMDVEVEVSVFWLVKGGFDVSLGIVGGIEAVMVLILIITNWGALAYSQS